MPGTLIVLFSYHHRNTEKIAKAIAEVIDAQIKKPQQMEAGDLSRYDLVGFGSGVYSGRHHESLLQLADRLPQGAGTKTFLFSTFGAPQMIANEEFILKNHQELREKLAAKGYTVLGEFGCAGLNTNSFLKFFGGLNKGRPNAGDLEGAKKFAQKMKGKIENEKQ